VGISSKRQVTVGDDGSRLPRSVDCFGRQSSAYQHAHLPPLTFLAQNRTKHTGLPEIHRRRNTVRYRPFTRSNARLGANGSDSLDNANRSGEIYYGDS
jgi:hypothetical protein